jgi:predicted neuraminidase
MITSQRRDFVFERGPTPSCHAATIAETAEGLVVAWFGGAREGAGDVDIWLSRKDAAGWSAPVKVASGTGGGGLLRRRYPCWNPVLVQPRHGPLMLFYKVGPSPSRWWGMWTVSHDHGRTWHPPHRLPHDILGPIKNKPVELPCGTLLCPSSCERTRWRVHIERCSDHGAAWRRGAALNDGRDFAAIQPALLLHGGGLVQLLCRTRQGTIAETWSEDEGHTWSPLQPTILPNPDSGIDAVALRDGRFLLVYNHAQTARSPLNLAISDDGRHWHALAVLEDAAGEFSYPAVIEGHDGTVHVAYTWNRRRIRRVSLRPGDGTAPAIDGGAWPGYG